ncbi:MAG: diaminopimelate epimerase [Candidatus Krumholzibacteriota bacterium]|nr:diaminopimelate epimerase [Candidatus Krumholzibacteriota bacterium]
MSAAGNVFYLTLAGPTDEDERRALARHACGGRARDASGGTLPAADGLILGAADPPGQVMLNPDGTEGMCGNGLRCLAALLAGAGRFRTGGAIETSDGPKRVWLEGDEVRAELGEARSLPGRPGSLATPFAVDAAGTRLAGYGAWLGNPHFVVFTDAATQARVRELGPRLQGHPDFPDGVNLELAVADPASGGWRVRVWERGVGETRSCGTGALAVAAAGPRPVAAGGRVVIAYPGGPLAVSRDAAGMLSLAGPVAEEGRFTIHSAGVPPAAAGRRGNEA